MEVLEKAKKIVKEIIQIPSFSREEAVAADYWEKEINQYAKAERIGNNVYVRNKYYNESVPDLLLFSHIDTVKPTVGYTMNPFSGVEIEGKIFGLGANDAGASLVSLYLCFLQFYEEPDLPFNLIFAAVAEEEISGKNGVELLLTKINPAIAIVGEPTSNQAAVAERGLLVLDAVVSGKSSHVAHAVGENAIISAMHDIMKLEKISFHKKSKWLGETKANVTVFAAGTQHNIIPGEAVFTIDVRLNDQYTHQEVFEILQSNLQSKLKARSMRLSSSSLPESHVFYEVIEVLKIPLFGSAALSDMALLKCPAVKMGPGDSIRSHTADEFVYISEMEEGIKNYTAFIEMLSQRYKTKEHEALEQKY